MIERTMESITPYLTKLLGDSAYGSAEMFGWLVYKHGTSTIALFCSGVRTSKAVTCLQTDNVCP